MAEQIMGDLAALKFETGDYATAAAYFQRIAPLYAEDRWGLIEATMLKMYAQCLKILHRRDDYSRVLLNLLAKAAAMEKSRSQGPTKKLPQSSAVNSKWLDDDDVDVSGQMTELLNFSSELPYTVTVPMVKYFDGLKIDPIVQHFQDKDGFKMHVKFRHLFEDNIEAEAIKLRLVYTSPGQTKEVWLQGPSPVLIKKGPQSFWLSTNISTIGQFNIEKLVIEASKVLFVHEFAPKPAASASLNLTASSAQASTHASKAPRILCYPRMGALNANVALCREIHIDKTKFVDIAVGTADNEVVSLDLRLRAGSAGLRLHTNRAEVVESSTDVHHKSNTGAIKFTELAVNTKFVVRIPYDVESTLRELSVRPEISYTTRHGEFIFLGNATIPVELPLDVNVFDIFKEKALFSKFTVRTATRIPLHLLSVALEESTRFAVASPSQLTSSTLVFSRGPASFSYKIVPKSSDSLSADESPMVLTVKYRCIDEDILESAEEAFRADVEKSSVADFAPILIPTLRAKLAPGTLSINYERAALLQTLNLGTFAEMGWPEIISSLPKPRRDEVSSWLQSWHEKTTIKLKSPSDPDYNTSRPSRTIVIAVDVPTIPVLHTATLSLPHVSAPNTRTPPLAALGHAIRAELSIRHTRRWDRHNRHRSAPAPVGDADRALDFVYEVHANPDVWLLGGQRRAYFTAREDETRTFALMLIPLVPGRHLLPRVEIRAAGPVTRGARAQRGREGEGEEAEEGRERVACETDYTSQGETVMVIADVKRTTVDMQVPGQAGGGAVLVASELRSEEVVV
ncbi:MAG: hypothetical protein M1822_010023 [Bathelium mastoideum]|nr:MAG: hypothetical protein M1822_010023 [Bathelium mastoideum]